jgi:hypothetical protein
MINTFRSKNKSWNVGDVVNVGFIKGLKVLKVEAVKDFMPDIYTLQGKNGALYEFIPHNGLTRIN